MSKLNRRDLFTLEDYARVRREFRNQVLAHKKNRKLELGPIATLYFEDRLTIQYQIQEMLRIERIFEPAGIADEDLERENEDKTSAVHWLRFELTPAMRTALRDGAELTAGCDLPAYPHATTLSQESREALLRDLD